MIVHTGYGMGDNFLERREVLRCCSDFFFLFVDIFSFFTGYEKGHIKSMHFGIFITHPETTVRDYMHEERSNKQKYFSHISGGK